MSLFRAMDFATYMKPLSSCKTYRQTHNLWSTGKWFHSSAARSRRYLASMTFWSFLPQSIKALDLVWGNLSETIRKWQDKRDKDIRYEYQVWIVHATRESHPKTICFTISLKAEAFAKSNWSVLDVRRPAISSAKITSRHHWVHVESI